jgi:hypothetical protein
MISFGFGRGMRLVTRTLRQNFRPDAKQLDRSFDRLPRPERRPGPLEGNRVDRLASFILHMQNRTGRVITPVRQLADYPLPVVSCGLVA